VEQIIARCANSQDPQKLVNVLEKIGYIDVPLEELEEHIKQKQAEKEKLLHEIEEARAVISSVNVDRQTIEDYKESRSEEDKYQQYKGLFNDPKSRGCQCKY
jgi:DNA repair exonuclease SbcCD ATPase subunit